MFRSRFQFTYSSERVVFSFIAAVVFLAVAIGVLVAAELPFPEKICFTLVFGLLATIGILGFLSVKRVQIDKHAIILSSLVAGWQKSYAFRELDGIFRWRHPVGRIAYSSLLLVKQGRVVASIDCSLFENFEELLAALPEGMGQGYWELGKWDWFKAVLRHGMWM